MNDFELTQQTQSLIAIDPAAVAAAESAKAKIQAAYIMALQRPRIEEQSRARILEACRRPEFAERVEFSKPVAGRQIKGPSIRFAELALREWGNIYSDIAVIYEDENTKRIKASVLDLQTNANFTKEITVKKTVERKTAKDRLVVGERSNTKGEKVYIVMATDDELNNKENAMISKALRNEGLRLIPSDIIDEAIEIARETMRNEAAEDPKAAKKKILDSFSNIGVQPKDIEKYLEHSLDTFSPAELENLRAIYRAIRDGEASWQEYINQKEENEKATGKDPDPSQKDRIQQKLDSMNNNKSTDKITIEQVYALFPENTERKLRDEFLTDFRKGGRLTQEEMRELLNDFENIWGKWNYDRDEKTPDKPLQHAITDNKPASESGDIEAEEKEGLLSAIVTSFKTDEIENAQKELGFVVGVNNLGTLTLDALTVLRDKCAELFIGA